MIQIYIGANRIAVPWHAPRADDTPPGQNIVCTAVSAPTLMLMEGLGHIARIEIAARTEPDAIGAALVDTC